MKTTSYTREKSDIKDHAPSSHKMILAQNNQYYHPLGSMNTNPQFNNHLRTPQPNSQPLQQVPDLMPSQPSWLPLGQPQQQHVPRTANRLGHQRESSLSSLGSNGPASPFNPNTSNPQIAVTDSSHEAFQDLSGGDNYSYQLSKPMSEGLFAGNSSGTMNVDGMPNMSAPQRSRQDTSLGLPSDIPAGCSSSNRSHPVSVTSSAAGGDSPATPAAHEPEDDGSRRKNGFQSGANPHNGVPKLDRTMTDIYSDELYAPGLSFTSASPPHSQIAMSPSNDLFAQRLQAANSQHMTAVQSPVSNLSRDKSPFRADSPYSSTLQDFSQSGLGQVRLPTAQQQRENKKADCDAREIQTHMARNNVQQQGTPSTISPKDAILEFNDPDDGSSLPLFPQQESSAFGIDQIGNTNLDGSKDLSHQAMPSFQSMASIPNNFNFSMAPGLQMPQEYPFVATRPRQQQLTPAASTFSRMSSADTSRSELSDATAKRPARTAADSGTYTCTYHGCTLRFETPMQLQKHKREGHRQANALNSMRPEPTMSSATSGTPESLLNTQAGPHRCDRINPSTGKPCSTIFSRPYDLTRHEDTIHNARKRKVRCNLCTEEKTFSRADALTRHYRVCHPDVDFPGKHRRRGTGAA